MGIRIAVSSVEELEAALRGVDHRARVVVDVVGAADISEAAVMYRRLEIHLAFRMGFLFVEEGGMEALRGATRHAEELSLLQIQLDLVDLDLEAGMLVKGARFQGVREVANDVVTTAPATSTLSVLDTITIEAQRVARVAKALGFGAVDVELPTFTEDDIIWLTAEDVGSGEVVVIGGDGDFHPCGHGDGDTAFHHGHGDLHHDGHGDGDSDSAFHHGHGDGEGTHGLVREVDLGGLHLSVSNGVGVVPKDSDNVYSEGYANDVDKALTSYKELVLAKEERVEALLRAKVSRIRGAIDRAKHAPFSV